MDDAIIFDSEEESGRLVSLAEVKAMLEKQAEEREELNEYQKHTLGYAQTFARVTVEGAEKMADELQAAFPSMSRKIALKFADLTPLHRDDIVHIIHGKGLGFEDADFETALDIVAKYYIE